MDKIPSEPRRFTVRKPPPLKDGTLPDVPRIDWKGYFYSFCRVHGEPELVKGRLVFRDGWTYSATDHRGPETPPPISPVELDGLVSAYWIARKSRCVKALDKAVAIKERIESEQRKRSLPLQQTVLSTDETGRRKTGYVPLNTSEIDRRIGWLRSDVAEADGALRAVEKFYSSMTEEK